MCIIIYGIGCITGFLVVLSTYQLLADESEREALMPAYLRRFEEAILLLFILFAFST